MSRFAYKAVAYFFSVMCIVVLPVSLQAEEKNPVNAKFENGYISFGDEAGNYQLKLDGRVQLDFGDIAADKNPSEADTAFRRIRLGLKSKLWQEWSAEFDVDFAGEVVSVKDMWVAYNGVPDWSFKVGNFKPHFSIDQVTSSRVATFMEASIATDALAPSRRIGVAADYANEHVFIGAGFFGDKVNDSTDDENTDNPDGADKAERFGYSMRGIYIPYFDQDSTNAFHIGINYLDQKPRTIGTEERKDGSIKFAVVAENELDETEYLDTGRMYGAESAVTTGLEIAGKLGSHIVIAEYLKTTVGFDDKHYTESIPDAGFDGYYLAYSYFLSGRREYDATSAEFAGVKGKNAVELTARYSYANFNDANGGNTKKRSATEGALVNPSIGIEGGEADIATLGVNWYPNPNLMFRVNYMMIDLDEHADADGDAIGNDKLKVLGMRVQFTF